ncbi:MULTISPECIES: hypothetical protein [Mameliella]|uniref:hypothetical protein n=1 Tax=Mameliella TaxID=1434019 RepID=UPI0008411C84|nr:MULTISPECIES: hypothetical protein [Mameliella]ODM48572.1 hypothetical protein A9320_02500 [Ruegeria sp. PBVC088]MBY6118955.1 hypothetical protein [Mameliella alba]MDD9733370.1 hypothetical protein [Mameliella sp. AT18]OWV43874.1 hypothetical protein CDZ95_09455 [Mameliella alba]OWV67544.1 hypothetical protein CDZ97_03685 [Mameliella alba]
MRGVLPILPFIAGLALGSAAAANQAEAYRLCKPEAERIAAQGGHYGYNTRYDMALDACMTAYRPSHQQAQLPGIGTLAPVAPVGCYPGAPTMYRGTLYCID